MSVEATCRSLSRSIYLHSEQTTPDGSVKWGNTAPTIGARSSFNLDLRGSIDPNFGLPYISIRPVILTRFPSMPDSIGDFETGEAGGIRPVKVWFR